MFKPVVGNLRPAGHMWPAKQISVAREFAPYRNICLHSYFIDNLEDVILSQTSISKHELFEGVVPSSSNRSLHNIYVYTTNI